MPQNRSAAKRVRRNARVRTRNRDHRSRMRTMVRRVLSMESHDEIVVALPAAQSCVDRLATKGVIHKNKAANLIRQMQQRQKSLTPA